MQQTVFQALVVEAAGKTRFTRTIRAKSIDDLPPGDVLIRVAFSSLNYKDALSATGNRGVTRDYPHTPGIDAAGVVAESASDLFKCGDPVLVTGYDLGMNTAGGFGQYIRVPRRLGGQPAGRIEPAGKHGPGAPPVLPPVCRWPPLRKACPRSAVKSW